MELFKKNRYKQLWEREYNWQKHAWEWEIVENIVWKAISMRIKRWYMPGYLMRMNWKRNKQPIVTTIKQKYNKHI